MAQSHADTLAPAGQVRVTVRSYFATPLAVMDLPDSPSLNTALRAVIMARADAEPSVEHSNIGGWQSSWDLTDWGGEAAQHVIDAATGLANQLTADREGNQVDIKWRINSWANVNRSGHANEFHTHPGAYWSGTYYVDDGGVHDDPSLGGEFEIQDPRGVAPAMYAPLLVFNMAGGQSTGASELVRPKAGTMMLFPSWLSHGVRPYRGDATRISIAFNLSV